MAKNAQFKKKSKTIEKRIQDNSKRDEKEEKAKAKKEAKVLKMSQSKVKRLERTKIISKKTKRGQPLMKDRIEFLLKKIQDSKKN